MELPSWRRKTFSISKENELWSSNTGLGGMAAFRYNRATSGYREKRTNERCQGSVADQSATGERHIGGGWRGSPGARHAVDGPQDGFKLAAVGEDNRLPWTVYPPVSSREHTRRSAVFACEGGERRSLVAFAHKNVSKNFSRQKKCKKSREFPPEAEGRDVMPRPKRWSGRRSSPPIGGRSRAPPRPDNGSLFLFGSRMRPMEVLDGGPL